ncbi:uncharacterized protein [Phyllobates terribilis]|uniref:uncharacterized protein n=1 Tax=Phyllobates terribilis TaxID=111132 RepID=UPI003CCB531D
MDRDRDKRAEKILHLTLEILFRLTGEDYTVVKKTSSERCQAPVSEGWGRPLSPIMGPLPHPLIHEDINEQKILELAYKMIELLTGEVPIRCQDITVYFSMEEWDYLEGHKDLYKDVKMEVPQPPSPVLSSERTTPERCPRPLLPQDCKQEDPNVPQDHQSMGKINNVSDKERAKQYRIRNADNVRESNKLRMQEKRKLEKENQNTVDLQILRRKERLRKAKYRKRKKSDNVREHTTSTAVPSTSSGTYRSPQAFGKGFKKTCNALPKSPSKKKAVLAKLVADKGLNLETPKKQTLSSRLEVQETVIQFYNKPDIVYTAPGMKDEMTIWKNGKKTKERKYYLTFSLREAYTVFCDTFTEIEVGFSTFCKLRPANVLLLHDIPADQCKCLTCANEFAKDKVNPQVRTMLIDFAMNYSCEYQSEVQSALWSRGSVTLFTTTFNGNCQTYLICSATKYKEKNTVACFISALYDIVEPKPDAIPDIDEVIWSDGPSSEFKNRFMTEFLEELGFKNRKPFAWKYFATAHGKGIVDGVGGQAKSLVRSHVMSKSASAPIVHNASDFSKLVKELMPKTRVLLINDQDISRDRNCKSVPIPGIKSMHILKASPNKCLLAFKNALSPGVEMNAASSACYKTGDWVIVKYDGKLYPGEITGRVENEYEISIMVQAGKTTYWKWPVKADKLLYSVGQILKKTTTPVLVNSRGQYKFEDNVL